MVAEFIENVRRHGRVKVVYRLYQRKDEEPRSSALHLAHHLFITLVLVILHILLVIFLFVSLLLLITLPLPYFPLPPPP